MLIFPGWNVVWYSRVVVRCGVETYNLPFLANTLDANAMESELVFYLLMHTNVRRQVHWPVRLRNGSRRTMRKEVEEVAVEERNPTERRKWMMHRRHPVAVGWQMELSLD